MIDTGEPGLIGRRPADRGFGSVEASSAEGGPDVSDAELDRFVAAHYPRLVGLAYYRTGDRQAAEDLAQEALLRLVSRWDQVASMEHPWSWLATVTVNLSNSRLRRQQVSRRAQALLGRRRESASRTQIALDDRVAILACVQALPERQRVAVLLRHYAKLSVRETAEAMGCAEGTVKSLTHSGIEQLRVSLISDGEAESRERRR